MHAKLSWIEHANTKILYADWKNLSDDNFVSAVEGIIELYKTSKPHSILVLIDVTNSYANEEVKKKMKYANQISAAKKIAGIGVTGIKRVIANVVKKDIYFANDMNDAKKYLVS